jgi:bisphosphoglycerate-dependent phosphoglycerate mutase
MRILHVPFSLLCLTSTVCVLYLTHKRYGALEGHSKPGLAHLYGDQIVQQWREGLTDRPPAMTPGTL